MKIKHLLIALFCIFAMNAHAQFYHFSVSTGTYSDLAGSVSLNNGQAWDDPTYTIPIGFNFDYFGRTINQLETSDLGGSLDANIGIDKVSILGAYGADVTDRGYVIFGSGTSLSDISYQLSGAVGSRILKIEWKNVGFYYDIDDDGVSTDFTNFQLWLYEGIDEIEIHFGPNSITQPRLAFDGGTGSPIFLVSEYDNLNDTIIGTGLMLSANPSSPTAGPLPLAGSLNYLTYLSGVIPNGTIYKFRRIGVGISEQLPDFQLTLYPNPVQELLHIKTDERIKKIEIFDLTGRTVLMIENPASQISLKGLRSGIYAVRLSNAEGESVMKKIEKR